MPIVVSYEDVNALGPLALTAGYQSGYGQEYAQGRAAQRNRQSQDQRFMMGNVFENQRLGMQQQFAADQNQQQMAFQGGQAEAGRQAQQQQFNAQLQAAQAQDATNFRQQQMMEQLRSTNDAERQMQNTLLGGQLKGEDEQRKLDLERNSFIQSAVGTGKAPQDAAKEWDQIQVEKASATGAFARRGAGGAGAGDKDELLGVYSGKGTQDAVVSAYASLKGIPAAISSHIQGLMRQSGVAGSDRALNVSNALNYVAIAASRKGYTKNDIQMAIQREPDPRVKAALQVALSQKVLEEAQPSNMPMSNTMNAPTTGGPGVGYGGGAPVSMKPPNQMTVREMLMMKGIDPSTVPNLDPAVLDLPPEMFR